MKTLKLSELKKIIDNSLLCDIAWQGIDSGGEMTTEEGVTETNRLRDKLANTIYRRIK